MRRFIPILLVLLLALPATAWAVRTLPGDGTLVVDNGHGVVSVRARGGIIGRFDSGSVVIEQPEGGKAATVYGAERISDLGNGRTRWTGEDVRFRVIGGLYKVRIQAVGIDVSAVGRGIAVLDATGFTDFAGRYSLNGGPFQSLPGRPTTYQLGQPPASGPIGK
jgi:hypothetical protein